MSAATEERSRSYRIRETVRIGDTVALTRDHVEYDEYGVPIDYPEGCYGTLLSFTNAGDRGIIAQVGVATDKGDCTFTVSAGALRRILPAPRPLTVKEKKALNYATQHGEAHRIALMACDALIRQSAGRDDGQEAIDLARMALGIDPIRPTQRLCGHRGCTLRSGHIPGHTDR